MRQNPNLRRLSNTQLWKLADSDPRNTELLAAIQYALQARTSLTGDGVSRHVSGLLAKAEAKVWRRSGAWKLAAAVAGFLVIGIGQAVSQMDWAAVWPRVQGLFAG